MQPLRYGIFPLEAGSAGAVQGTTAPSKPAKALAALRRLRPPGRELVLRLNRMFWSDGRAGLDRFAGLVDGYARAGFRSELQVRYHPPDGHAGDIASWLAYVREAVVGLQVYPGLFWPPATTDPGGDVVEALTLLRDCWMPKAGLGRDVALSITENGRATRGGAGEDRQAADLRTTLDAVSRWSGTLGVTDYRYFNLRDNASRGADLFDAVGLLFDDYREKQAFGAYRDAIARTGAAPASPRLRVAVRPRRVVRRRRVVLRVRVTAGGRPVQGAVVRVGSARRVTGRRGRARVRYRFVGRVGRRVVRVVTPALGAAGAGIRVVARGR
jgi:hypothetical protein